jgi:hypothetical protein
VVSRAVAFSWRWRRVGPGDPRRLTSSRAGLKRGFESRSSQRDEDDMVGMEDMSLDGVVLAGWRGKAQGAWRWMNTARGWNR